MAVVIDVRLEQGNAHAIMGQVSYILKQLDMRDKIEEYYKEATSGDYKNLLEVSKKYTYDLIEFVGLDEDIDDWGDEETEEEKDIGNPLLDDEWEDDDLWDEEKQEWRD